MNDSIVSNRGGQSSVSVSNQCLKVIQMLLLSSAAQVLGVSLPFQTLLNVIFH